MQNIARSWVLGLVLALAFPGGALAQESFEDPGPEPEPTPSPAVEPEPEPGPAEASEPFEAGPSAAAPMEAGGSDEPAPPPAPAPAPAEEESSFLDNLGFRMFVDSYYMKDWLFPEDDQQIGTLTPHRAFARTNGFAVSFVALDVDYQTDQFGATVNLRWGSSVPQLIIGAPDRVDVAVENLKQGFLSWRPVEGLQLDMGQFDTIYGAEVSESFENINYTRGALYFLMQPFYHTGLRAAYQVNDKVSLTGLLVNATNDHIDGNPYPDVGIQAGITPTDDTSIVAGYLVNLTENETTGDLDHQHFFDVVASASIGDLTLIFNGDLGITVPDDAADPLLWYGLSLAAGYAVTDWFDVGVRGEFLHDPDSFFYGDPDGTELVTGTLTLGFKPIPNRDNVIIRLDNRIEWASTDMFPENGNIDDPTTVTELSDIWGSTVLGVVVKTD